MVNTMRCPGSQVLHRQPVVTNIDKVIQFMLGDQILERRLVLTAFEPTEISTASPGGCKLGQAKPGDTFTITVPEGFLVVKVLAVGGVAAMPPA